MPRQGMNERVKKGNNDKHIAQNAESAQGGAAGAEKEARQKKRERARRLVPPEGYVPVKRKGARWAGYRFAKRAFDIFCSLAALLLSGWLIALCLLFKWLEDFHSPLYVSERVGKDGRLFRFYKIRTMCPHADRMKAALIADGRNEADGPAFKMKDDPRVTPLGRVLRKWSLDELPQFFNVLNGTLSLVGPRSPLEEEVARYTPEQWRRLGVKGGLLCLWQIQHARNSLSFGEWVALDTEYIERQSFLLDLKILGKGAYMVLFDRSGQ